MVGSIVYDDTFDICYVEYSRLGSCRAGSVLRKYDPQGAVGRLSEDIGDTIGRRDPSKSSKGLREDICSRKIERYGLNRSWCKDGYIIKE